MYSTLYFNTTLSTSDISTLSSAPSSLHVLPACRCPPSHPIALQFDCQDLSGTSTVSRVNTGSHDSTFVNDGELSTWWQSANGVAPVNLTLSLGGLREAMVIAMQFNSLLPRAMVLSFSTDGENFSPRQYYAADCSVFGLPNNGLLRSSTAVNCINSYSFPLTNVFVEFRILDIGNRPGADSIDSFNLNPELQQFAQATHIRVEMVDWNSDEPSEQYFAITEVFVYGRGCVCNGHADACSEADCVCSHNAMGSNCEECLPLFNDQPWAPGTVTSANACEMCECNGHASSCAYNETTLSGVCVDCGDNTEGDECQTCTEFHYRPSGVPRDSSMACSLCDCHPEGITDNGDCLRGDTLDGSDSGQCSCKEFVSGRGCNQCLDGYFGLNETNPQGCTECGCNTTGTVGGSGVCNQTTGQCPCKTNVVGLQCDTCDVNHFGIEMSGGCLPCHEECVGCTGLGATECLVSVM